MSPSEICLKYMKKFGVFVGRLCPIHLGHERTIERMIADCGVENCLLVVGSSNTPMSLRYFFNYQERRKFVKMIFPKIKIVGLPDYNNDGQWLLALDDLTNLANTKSLSVVYYGGCDEDVRYFTDDGRKTKIVNRFDGSTPKISATEVRDALIQNRNVSGLVNKKIEKEIKKLFAEKWEIFKKM